jgi:hypothetical protein
LVVRLLSFVLLLALFVGGYMTYLLRWSETARTGE